MNEIKIKGQTFKTNLTHLNLSNLSLRNKDIKQLKYMTNLKHLDLIVKPL